MENLIIYGAGDFCSVIIWYIDMLNAEKERFKILGVLDDFCEKGTLVEGYPVLGDSTYFESVKDEVSLVLSISSPDVSRKIVDSLSQYEFINYPAIIAPGSIVADNVKIGKGSIIPPGAIVATRSTIGDFVKIGQGASISHHCSVGDHSFVGPRASLTGHVTVGESCFVGASATVLPEMTVVDNTVIGAGAVVTKHITEKGRYIGIPARRME